MKPIPPRRHILKPALFHGLDERGRLVCVEDLETGGNTDLRCPYCNELLCAKKGEFVRHHFAHAIGKSDCAALRTRAPRIRIPLFDTFDWGLAPSTIRAFERWRRGEWEGSQVPADAALVRYNDYMGRWEGTNRGKVITGQLSLRLFCELQEPILQEQLHRLERDAATGGEEEQTDLALYRASYDRATSLPLVLSQAVDKDGAPVDGFHLIGTDSAVPYPVKVVPGRAHILTYFRHRYRSDLATLPGTKRTAFRFWGEGYDEDYLPSSVEAELRTVIRDLGRIPKKVQPT